MASRSNDTAIQPKVPYVPLVVGVTGHRDLVTGDLPVLERVVGEVIGQLQRDHPHTPLVLLSSLAEGADRLVARVATRMGVRMLAVLPMPKDLYAQDFQSEPPRQEFEDLLARAERCQEMPLAPGAAAEEVAHPTPKRDRQYEAAGIYIAVRAQVLIALMEEGALDRIKVGGTSHIVSCRLGLLPWPTASPGGPGPAVAGAAPGLGQPGSAASHPGAWLGSADLHALVNQVLGVAEVGADLAEKRNAPLARPCSHPIPAQPHAHPRASWPIPWKESIASCSIWRCGRCWRMMTVPPAAHSSPFTGS